MGERFDIRRVLVAAAVVVVAIGVGATTVPRANGQIATALRLQDLRAEPWIGGAPSSAWYRIVRHACQLAGFSPQGDLAADDYIAVQALVAAGFGVSVIPGLAVAHPLPGVVARPLASAAPVRHVSAAWPTDGYRGPTLTAMVECLRLAAENLR